MAIAGQNKDLSVVGPIDQIWCSAANKPYLIDVDVDIAADINQAGSGIRELPGLGCSKPSIGKQYQA